MVVVVLRALLLGVPVLAVAAEIVVRLAPQKVDREIDPVVALCQQEALVVLVGLGQSRHRPYLGFALHLQTYRTIAVGQSEYCGWSQTQLGLTYLLTDFLIYQSPFYNSFAITEP